jgi:translation elongation factor EF-G
MGKFTREDPTLRVDVNEKTGETLMSGMGELHLEIYIERMKREYAVEWTAGNSAVNYKETITDRSKFDYLHKKQSGGKREWRFTLCPAYLLRSQRSSALRMQCIVHGFQRPLLPTGDEVHTYR